MSNAERFWLLVAIGLGAVVRLLPVLGAAGAVGDGGLIYTMVQDVRAAGLTVPAETSYNALGIPFVYPPAAIWSAAALGEAIGVSTLDLLRWLPLVLSVAVLGTFAWLAWRVLPPVAAIGAAFAYALMPHAYDWVIAGGGLTRGLGLLSALIAMAIAAGPPRAPRWAPALAGFALGVAFLSHPQAAIFGTLGCLVLSWSPAVGRWARSASVAGGVALAVMLPWLIAVTAAHGPDALLSPANRLEPLTGLIRLSNLRFSGAPFMDVFAVVGAVGVLVVVLRGPHRLALLLLLTYVAGAGGGEFLAAVPWALSCGVGAAAVIQVAIPDRQTSSRRVLVGVTAGVVLFLALIGTLASVADGSSKLHSLSEHQLKAMAWLANHTSGDARVIVPVAGVWGDDEVSEWLPALADRRSVGTVQGSEWLGAAGFERQLATHNAIRDCSGSTVPCYAAIDSRAVLFIPKGQLSGPFSPGDCCPALRESVDGNGYEVIYDGPGATIARPRE